MKAFHQIDLRLEKKFVWTRAALLGLLGVLFILYPMQVSSAGSHHVSLKADASTCRTELIFRSIVKASSQGCLAYTDSIHPDSRSPVDNKWQASSSLKLALPLLFSNDLRHQIWWEWNPEDSSLHPHLKNQYIFYTNASKPILDN